MSDSLREERVQKFFRNVRDEYDEESIIKKGWIVKSREATPSDVFSFVQIGVRYLVDRAIFRDPSYYPAVLGAGSTIAIAEEKYLVKTLLNRILRKRVKKESLSFKIILEALEEAGPDFHPSAVFVPLAFHNDLHLNRVPGVKLYYDQQARAARGPLLIFGSAERPRVFWSNKYVPFQSLIFVDQNIGEWVVKTVDRHWLVFDIRPAKDRSKVDVTIKTVACFVVSNPSAGVLLDVPLPRE